MVTSLGCGGLADIPDPDPRTWIQIPTLDTKQLLGIFYILLVCWKGGRGSTVGWSSCSYVPILFRSTSRKFVPHIEKDLWGRNLK